MFLLLFVSVNEVLVMKMVSEVNIEVVSDDDGVVRIEMVCGDEGARAGRARRRRFERMID